MAVSVIRLLPALLLNGLLASGALMRGSVSRSGAASGFILGTVIYLSGGPGFWALLVAFFLSSTLLSRFGREGKKESGRIQERGSRRDWVQVLANGGVGAMFALLYMITGERLFAAAVAAAFAAANADTWASEIGALSGRPPVSVLDGTPLPPGTSGGVTALGYLAAAGGALVIGAVYLVQGLFLGWLDFRLFAEAVMVGAGGFFGAWIDSVIGATLQAKYVCAVEGTETERRFSGGVRNTLVRGLPFMTNDAVNFTSGLLSTGAAALLLAVLFDM